MAYSFWRRLSILALFICALATTPVHGADEAQAAFDRLFGDAMKAAATSRDTKDDIELAQTLLDAGASVHDNPGLVELLYLNAYTLGLKDVKGYPIAISAATRLATAFPVREREAQDKLLAVYQLKYQQAPTDEKAIAADAWVDCAIAVADLRANGGDYDDAIRIYRLASSANGTRPQMRDQLMNSIRVATQRNRAVRTAKTLETKIQADSGDKASHKTLALLELADLDDASKASPHMEASGDDALIALAPLVVKPAAELSEAEALRVARFYRELAKGSNPASRPAIQGRAHDAFTRFTELHEAQDTARLEATTAIKDIEKDAEKYPPATFTLSRGKAAPIPAEANPAGASPPSPAHSAERPPDPPKPVGNAPSIGKGNIPQGVTVGVFNPAKSDGPYLPFEELKIALRIERSIPNTQWDKSAPRLSEQTRINGAQYPKDAFDMVTCASTGRVDYEFLTYWSPRVCFLVPPKPGKYTVDIVFSFSNRLFWVAPAQAVEVAVPVEEKEAYAAIGEMGIDRYLLDKYGMRRDTTANTPPFPYARVVAYVKRYPASAFSPMMIARAVAIAEFELNDLYNDTPLRFLNDDRKEVARVIALGDADAFVRKFRERIPGLEKQSQTASESYRNRIRRVIAATELWSKLVDESRPVAPNAAGAVRPSVRGELPDDVAMVIRTDDKRDSPFLPYDNMQVMLRSDVPNFTNRYKAWAIKLSEKSRINGAPFPAGAFANVRAVERTEKIFFSPSPWLLPSKPGKYKLDLVFDLPNGSAWAASKEVEVVLPPEEQEEFAAFEQAKLARFLLDKHGMRLTNDPGAAPLPFAAVNAFIRRYPDSRFTRVLVRRAQFATDAELNIDAYRDPIGRRFLDADRKELARIHAANDRGAGFIAGRKSVIEELNHDLNRNYSEQDKQAKRRGIVVNQEWIKLVEEAAAADEKQSNPASSQ